MLMLFTHPHYHYFIIINIIIIVTIYGTRMPKYDLTPLRLNIVVSFRLLLLHFDFLMKFFYHL